MPANHVIFGWGAPPLKEQHPCLDQVDAEHFDQDNMALVRLHVRGLLTERERDAARRRLTKAIEAAIVGALQAARAVPA